jgi:hypothetical protein
MLRKNWGLLAALATLGSVALLHAGEPIAPEDVSKLHALIRPHAGEAKWSEIPWIADIHEARTKAANEGKPLYIWSASADAMGCT